MTASVDAFDYVIVGAGSAGCVLADRLTEDGRDSTLVLEYGGSDRSIFLQMPSALSIPMGMEKYDWRYYTEPEPGLGGRRLHTPRGKVLGGSSSINGLVYVRGNALDFERWEQEGASRLELRGGPALLPPRGDACRRRRRVSRRFRTAADFLRPALESPACGLARGGPAGRLPGDRRRQRPPAGRLRPARHDGRRRAPLERRQRVSAPRDDALESRGPDARARDANPVRRQARRGRRVPPGRCDAHRACAARSHPERGIHQFAEAPETLRRRPGRRAA